MKMTLINILILFILSISSRVEIFSGKVSYVESYVSNDPNLSVADVENLLGTKRDFYIQGQFYKSVSFGNTNRTLLYRGDENRIYRFEGEGDTVYWKQAVAIDSLSNTIDISVEASDEIVLGLKCRKIKFISRSVVTTYYFNKRYGIDPEAFRNHKLESWDLYTRVARAVPLKIVLQTPKLTVSSTAVKIEGLDLADSVFERPPGCLKEL